MAMIAAGLERQLGRCNTTDIPDFCSDAEIYGKVKLAYEHVWDIIESNLDEIESEMWTWTYSNGTYTTTDLVNIQAPPGTGNNPEADVRQLWSLTFLAVTRNKNL